MIDRHLDARNPRTAGRHLPRGLLAPRDLLLPALASAALFLVAAWRLGPVCLALAPVALVFLVGYSYTKRFTWLSHWILGLTDGAAAAGAWIAVRGTMEAPAWLLWLSVTVWIAGFDLLYACQDVAFDRREGLHSVPARFGIAAALGAARVSHLLTALALAGVGWTLGLGVPYWIGWLVVVGLLVYEHSLVAADDLSRLDVAFFNVNGYISVITFVAAVAGLWY
jgi:4-hydroxybenzoate polyprenyltransferase